MKAKTGFGNMAGKGSAKRPYDVKKFDSNYPKPSGKFKSCENCVELDNSMFCLRHNRPIKNSSSFRCEKWVSK